MKRILIIIFSLPILTMSVQDLSAQDQKIWISGMARSVLYTDKIIINSELEDTITARKLNSGHVLADLDVNIRPNENIFIRGTLRVRNDQGGFWGSGTSFDLRQLYVKGIIANAVRFQVGDINYKLTDYTFANNEEFLSKNRIEALDMNREFVHQDLFYTDDLTWRQQGVAVDFGLDFNKVIEEMTFDLFTFRLNPTNFGSSDDQLMSGGVSQMAINKIISLEGAFTSTYEIEGTGTNDDYFKNNIGSGALILNHVVNEWPMRFKGEMGTSLWEKSQPDANVKLEDYFMDLSLSGSNPKENIEFRIGYRDIGPNYRSIAAQTQRINYTSANAAFTRYGNDSDIRNIGIYDLYRDVTLYNFQFSQNLMPYNSSYGNLSPYGKATPNRRVFGVNVKYKDLEERFEGSAEVNMGTEVIGQGTTNLREFSELAIKGKVNISKFVNFERKTELQFAIWNERTQRSSDSEFETIDLGNSLLSLGLNANVYADLDLIFGYQFLVSEGNELKNRRNEEGEIIAYDVLETDLSESLLSCGIQYRFNESSKINVLWNTYSAKDDLAEMIPYDINTVSINYRIIF